MDWTIGYITEMTEAEYTAIYATLSASRKAHIDRMKQPNARKRSLLATQLTNALLEKHSDGAALLETAEDGRPYLEGCPLHISISHSAEAVVCAVSTDHVGIDVEQIRPVDRKLIDYVCTERERAYVLEQAEEIDTRFFEVWTAKEACYKHDGGTTPLRAIDTLERHKHTVVTNGYCITIV